MRPLVLLFLLQLFGNGFVSAQVVIQNHDFQLSDSCPVASDQFEKLSVWKQVTGNPDFFDCDYTFQIDFPLTDYDPGQQNYVGIKVEDDSLQSADSFGQNLNEPILPGEFVSMTIVGQTVYGGAYSGDCAGISVYGLKDSLGSNLPYNNIGELPNVELLGSTAIYEDFWWDLRGISFTAVDTINAIILSPQLIDGCKEYFFIDRIHLSNQVGMSEEQLARFQIYPNPVGSTMSIQSSEELVGLPYKVVSITGRVVQSGSLTESIDVSKIDSGVYFLRVKTQNGEVDQRFIKD